MTNRRLFVAALLGRGSRARLEPARSTRRPSSARCTSARSTTPAPRSPTSARPTSSSARTTSPREVLQGRAGRRADADRRCSSTTARPPRNDISHIRTRAARVRQDADDRRRSRTRWRSSRSASGRPIFTELHVQPGRAAEGHRSHLVDAGLGAAVPARRHHRGLPGLQEARRRAPGHRRHHERRPGVEQPRSTIRCSTRCAPAAPRSTRSRSASPSSSLERRDAQAQHRARRGPARRPAAATTNC